MALKLGGWKENIQTKVTNHGGCDGFPCAAWHWMLTFGTSVLGSSVHLANQRAAISSLQALFGLCLLVQ